MTESEARLIFDEYKMLYPQSIAEFSVNPNKIALWQWSIKNAKRRDRGTDIDVTPPKSAQDLRYSRRVESFEQFPYFTQQVYLCAADFFPGIQLSATGSRVNGDYIDPDSPPEILDMRRVLGKANKQRSDYDFTLYSHKAHTNEIEQCRKFISQQFYVMIDVCPFALVEQKINIPMWDFDKLTDEQKRQARALTLEHRWGALMKLHNEWKLSPNHYCCNEAPIIKWFTWALKEGKI